MTAYFDYAATTPVCASAIQAVQEMLADTYGNPSSLHAAGVRASRALEAARSTVASALKTEPDTIYFTSGGTEANNLAILGAVEAGKRHRGCNRIVTSAIEHESVLHTCKTLEAQGYDVVYLMPDQNGNLEKQAIFDAINEKTILISLMLVNNEIGSILPVQAVSAAVKRTKSPALIHCDAVQGFGKLPVSPKALGVDLLTISAHKIYGPKGTGALYVRKGVRILPQHHGGAQEKGLRPGTEATPLIAGFGAAVSALPSLSDAETAVQTHYDRVRSVLQSLPEVQIHSSEAGSCYVLNFSVPGIPSEVMLNALSANGIYVSSGSACAKGKASHVLDAMGLSKDLITSAIRVSFSHLTTEGETDALIQGITDAMQDLRRVI